MIEFVVAVVLHTYVLAPVAVSVVDCPVQSVEVPLTVTVGSGFTTMSNVACDVQPFASVPVTVYVCDEEGVTVSLAPVPPLDQL